VVTITHDRVFLDRVATRIVELDRGHLRSYPGNFSQYQVQKEEQLAQEAVISAKADKLLAQEEVWIRKGVEARRTRRRPHHAPGQIAGKPCGTARSTGQRQARRRLGLPSGKMWRAHARRQSFGEKTIVRDFTGLSCAATKWA